MSFVTICQVQCNVLASSPTNNVVWQVYHREKGKIITTALKSKHADARQETPKSCEQNLLKNTFYSFSFVSFFRCNKLSQNCRKDQQTSVIEIALQRQAMEDRPAPAILSSRLTSPTTFSTVAEPAESSSYSGAYSRPYQHMGQRIMAFLSLQRRGMPAPYVTRLSSVPMGVLRQSQEMSDYLEPRGSSDFLEPVINNNRQNEVSDTRSDMLYERIYETHMVEQSGLQDESQEISSYSDSDYLNPVETHDNQNGPLYEEIDDNESQTIV